MRRAGPGKSRGLDATVTFGTHAPQVTGGLAAWVSGRCHSRDRSGHAEGRVGLSGVTEPLRPPTDDGREVFPLQHDGTPPPNCFSLAFARLSRNRENHVSFLGLELSAIARHSPLWLSPYAQGRRRDMSLPLHLRFRPCDRVRGPCGPS